MSHDSSPALHNAHLGLAVVIIISNKNKSYVAAGTSSHFLLKTSRLVPMNRSSVARLHHAHEQTPTRAKSTKLYYFALQQIVCSLFLLLFTCSCVHPPLALTHDDSRLLICMDVDGGWKRSRAERKFSCWTDNISDSSCDFPSEMSNEMKWEILYRSHGSRMSHPQSTHTETKVFFWLKRKGKTQLPVVSTSHVPTATIVVHLMRRSFLINFGELCEQQDLLL